jgi:formylglycine-generating enzyme required for sulfatase activity
MKYKITTGKLKGEILELEEVKTTTFNGLEWSETSPNKMTWQEAQDYAKSLGDGWRLPTIKEWQAVIDYSKCNPATDLPNTQSDGYWSSTTYADIEGNAWIVYMDDGYVYDDDKDADFLLARCVR